MTPKQHTRTSKFLSLVLRHKPEAAGIELDTNGWASVAELLKGCAASGYAITRTDLTEIVETCEKQRYSFDPTKTHIRANQGHSVAVDLEFAPADPPEFLYHGTATSALGMIYSAGGINKMRRLHVHLSADIQTAKTVGSRHGTPAIIRVAAQRMHANGFPFFLSANGVWLTDTVPCDYMEVMYGMEVVVGPA